MKYKWFIIVPFALLVVVGLAWKLGLLNPLFVSLNTPACSEPVLITAPVSDEAIDSITPLGNISLPNHALPTEHTYFVLKRGADGLPLKTEVVAPADLVVESISYISTTRNGQLFDADYKIDMAVCKKVAIKFDHIRELSPVLKTAYEASKPKCQESQRGSDELNSYCNVSLNIKLSAGELIGVAGGGIPTGIDFGATDGRQIALEFANNSRYRSNTRHAVCPYDLFGSEMKTHFYGFLGDTGQKRTIEPRCGTIAQDIPGTAQGNWFIGKGGSDDLERKQKSFSLIHDNVDAALGMVIVGSQNAKVAFVPTHSGLINREFSEITPGETIYCYQPDATGGRASYGVRSQFNGSVLIRLVSTTELDLEIKSEACGKASFTQPTRLIR